MEENVSIREYLVTIREALGKLHVLNDESSQMSAVLNAIDKTIDALKKAEKGVIHNDDQNEQRKDA